MREFPGLLHDVYYLVDADGQPIPGSGTIWPTAAEFELYANADAIKVEVWKAETGVKLDVPWLSQLGPDAEFAPGDCGPACLAMWLNYLLPDGNITVDEVSAQSGLDEGFKYTTPGHLIKAARYYGVDLYWRRSLAWGNIEAEIAISEPCIVLVHYPFLEKKYDPNFDRGHWLLMTGCDVEGFYYHDPYWSAERFGAHIYIDKRDFDRAWGSNHLDGNSDRQALRIRA